MTIQDKLAAIAHELWAAWVDDFMDKAIWIESDGPGGSHTEVHHGIDKETADKWDKLARTSFNDLSDEDKAAPLEIADNILKVLLGTHRYDGDEGALSRLAELQAEVASARDVLNKATNGSHDEDSTLLGLTRRVVAHLDNERVLAERRQHEVWNHVQREMLRADMVEERYQKAIEAVARSELSELAHAQRWAQEVLEARVKSFMEGIEAHLSEHPLPESAPAQVRLVDALKVKRMLESAVIRVLQQIQGPFSAMARLVGEPELAPDKPNGIHVVCTQCEGEYLITSTEEWSIKGGPTPCPDCGGKRKKVKP
jgi:hypothetical protein